MKTFLKHQQATFEGCVKKIKFSNGKAIEIFVEVYRNPNGKIFEVVSGVTNDKLKLTKTKNIDGRIDGVKFALTELEKFDKVDCEKYMNRLKYQIEAFIKQAKNKRNQMTNDDIFYQLNILISECYPSMANEYRLQLNEFIMTFMGCTNFAGGGILPIEEYIEQEISI